MRNPSLTGNTLLSSPERRAMSRSGLWFARLLLLMSAAGCAKDNSAELEPPEPYMPVCGNGILDEIIGEQCDDGNYIEYDGCTECREDRIGLGKILWQKTDVDGNVGMAMGYRGVLYLVSGGQVMSFNPIERQSLWKASNNLTSPITWRTMGVIDSMVITHGMYELESLSAITGVSQVVINHTINSGIYDINKIATDENYNVYLLEREGIRIYNLDTLEERQLLGDNGHAYDHLILDGSGGGWTLAWTAGSRERLVHFNLIDGSRISEYEGTADLWPVHPLAAVGASEVYFTASLDEDREQGVLCHGKEDANGEIR